MVCSIGLVACNQVSADSNSGGVGTTQDPTALASSTSADLGIGSASDPVANRPTAVDPNDARALITATGVVVSVDRFTGDGFDIVTPCGESGTVSWGTPIAEADVVLDPGHGGAVETGAVGSNGLVERDLNLAVARRTSLVLAERGVTAVLTRTGDYRMPLATRAGIANRLEARAMVSIHHNAPAGNPSTEPGTEIFVKQDDAESRRLGGTIYRSVFEALDRFDIDWQTAPDAGVLAVINDSGEDSYGMIRRPEMPAVLVELGYLANPAEAELFATDAYLEAASVALADGIEAWLTTDDRGEGFVAEARVFTPNGLTGGSSGCVDPALETPTPAPAESAGSIQD